MDYSTRIKGNIFAQEDEDIYSFFVGESGKAGIALIDLKVNLDLEIYDVNRNRIKTETSELGDVDEVEIGCREPGIYYIKVANPERSIQCNPYSLLFAWNGK